MFSTINQLSFLSTSRKDDLVSLCYLLVFLLNEGDVPYSSRNFTNELTISKNFKKAKKIKQTFNLQNAVRNRPRILEFVESIQKLGHYQKPNYESLRTILKSSLADPGQTSISYPCTSLSSLRPPLSQHMTFGKGPLTTESNSDSTSLTNYEYSNLVDQCQDFNELSYFNLVDSNTEDTPLLDISFQMRQHQLHVNNLRVFTS